MAKYYIDLVDPFGITLSTEDQVFTNLNEAEEYAIQCNNDSAEGAECLEDDDDYMDPDTYKYIVRPD